MHVECSEIFALEDEGTNLTNNDNDKDVRGQDESDGFDPALLEEAIQELYDGSRSMMLEAMILVINLCTIHGINNKFVDELFIILYCYLLPKGNTLPRNHYVARTLNIKLGLAYNTIYACENYCILFRGGYADAEVCSKCGGPRFSNVEWKKFLVKVLRYFLIIPQLQRMFCSPTISSLMRWHEDNRSDKEGGDGLVKLPCDSKAWKHFHSSVDQIFENDVRNVHFDLATNDVNPFK